MFQEVRQGYFAILTILTPSHSLLFTLQALISGLRKGPKKIEGSIKPKCCKTCYEVEYLAFPGDEINRHCSSDIVRMVRQRLSPPASRRNTLQGLPAPPQVMLPSADSDAWYHSRIRRRRLLLRGLVVRGSFADAIAGHQRPAPAAIPTLEDKPSSRKWRESIC